MFFGRNTNIKWLGLKLTDSDLRFDNSITRPEAIVREPDAPEQDEYVGKVLDYCVASDGVIKSISNLSVLTQNRFLTAS